MSKRYADPSGELHDLDLGDGHWLDWLVAAADDDTRVGAIITNTTDKTESGLCFGSVDWAPTTWAREHPEKLSDHERNRSRWTLHGATDEHLTISPSVLCHECGDHGFIRDGKWIRA